LEPGDRAQGDAKAAISRIEIGAAESGLVEDRSCMPGEASTNDALHAARMAAARLSPDEYLAFLEALPQPTVEELRRRPISCGVPFKL
jgi:hypothetical protein